MQENTPGMTPTPQDAQSAPPDAVPHTAQTAAAQETAATAAPSAVQDSTAAAAPPPKETDALPPPRTQRRARRTKGQDAPPAAPRSKFACALRRTGLVLACLVLAVVLALGGYVLYLTLQYSRIPDNTALAIDTPQKTVLQQSEAYSAVSYNIGFGAYDHDYSFFMDTGVMEDGTPVAGKYGKARSREAAQTNTTGSVAALRALAADFYLLQEVDRQATRSFKIDQTQAVRDAMPGYAFTYASNFHSAFLALPLNDMHGAVEAGLVTLSRYQIGEALRRSYPVDGAFPTKFFDLDRCFTQLRLPVHDADGKDTGKELVLLNSHMSAYDEGGTIRAQQLELLNSVLETEVAKGNYVIVGGDFNHALYGSETAFASQQQFPVWVSLLKDDDLASGFQVVEPGNSKAVATCRTCDLPYEEGVNYRVSVDGFIVSDNIEATAQNIDLDFAYSDHNPVQLQFTLLP